MSSLASALSKACHHRAAFFRRKRKMALAVHGDCFPALGQDWALNLYENGMQAAFDVEVKGRVGSEDQDSKEVKPLNRVLRMASRGLAYDADPRHVELLARALGLENSPGRFAPGAKRFAEEEVAGCKPKHEDPAKEEMVQFVNELLAQPSLLARP